MKYLFIVFILTLLPCAAIASPLGDIAHSLTDFDTQKATIRADKFFALDHLTQDLKDACVSDYQRKLGTHASAITPEGDMVFSEPFTRSVSTTLFWNNAERGVAFTMPIKQQFDGNVVNIACLYGVQTDGLAFQMSQKITPPQHYAAAF